MSLTLERLYDQIIKYNEAEDLRNIIAAYSSPIILKIAQEQLKLFEESKEVNEELDDAVDFSFKEIVGTYGLDYEGAEFLDLLVEEIVKTHPDKSADQLVEEIKKEFFSSGYSSRMYYSGRWISTNHDRLKKYISLAPSLSWKPTQHQISIPFKEIPVSLQLGGGPGAVEEEKRNQELAIKIKNEVFQKEEYRPLKMPYYEGVTAAGGYNQYSNLVNKKENEIKEKFKENNIPEKYLSDSFEKKDFLYIADQIEEEKRDLEKRWHKLKTDNDLLMSEISLLNPGSFTVKPSDEIRTHEDLVYSIAEYAIWASKLFISQHVDYKPIFDERWKKTGPTSGWVDISDLQKLLELEVRSLDPATDYKKKSAYMNKMEEYCSTVLNYIRTWKSIFKKIDKKLFLEIKNKMSGLKPQNIKLYRWVEKFRPEVIKKTYSEYISKIASNIPSESDQFPIEFKDVSLKQMNDITALDFSNLFLKKRTQSELLSNLSNSIFESLFFIGNQLLNELQEKIETHLFSLSKNIFENKYFEIDLEVSSNGKIERTYNLEYVPIEKIKLFINDWSGKPNIKSFENVILSLTKDPSYVDDFYKVQLTNKFTPYFQKNYPKLYDVIPKFISKLKVGSEDEIFRVAKEELLPDYYSEIMHDAAKQIASSLSNTQDIMRHGVIKVSDQSFSSIAPVINSNRFKSIGGSIGQRQELSGLTASSLIYKARSVIRNLEEDIRYGSGVGVQFFEESELGKKLYKVINEDLSLKSDSEKSGGLTLLSQEYLSSVERALKEGLEIASSIKFSPEYYKKEDVDLLLKAVDELRRISKTGSFISLSEEVASVFGGIGYKDISFGIDKLFDDSKIVGVSKKEFIQIISQYISGSLLERGLQPIEKIHVSSFLDSIKNGNFKKYISKMINALELKNTKSILAMVETANSNVKNRNISEEDLLKAIRALKLQNMSPQAAAERWIKSASFIHNHSAIPMNYIKNLLNSPNFLSDTEISKEFIESCTKIYLAGGISNYKIPKEGSGEVTRGTIVKGLIENGLIADQAEFYRVLNAFSRLCANKDGVRPNLGNGTAEMKLHDWIKSNKMNYIEDTPGWDDMDFDAKTRVIVQGLKEMSVGFTEKEEEEIIKDFYEKTIKKIIESSSTKEQYEKDLKIKSLIQSASSKLKLVESSEVMLRYAKHAKKKDPRLFDFQLNFPNMPLRFRVLKDLDPYHFEIGADTNCCQRIGGQGANAAIDSFINPLAGVLVLESNTTGGWVTLSQSYFHFVPTQNGVILDNVEWNMQNISKVEKLIPFNIDQLYATFAQYIKDKNNLNYVRCGAENNKLTNRMFTTSRINGGDPRHIEHSQKYTDFSASSHIDLLSPKFDVKIKLDDKKSMSIYSKLIKLSSYLKNDERLELLDICFF